MPRKRTLGALVFALVASALPVHAAEPAPGALGIVASSPTNEPSTTAPAGAATLADAATSLAREADWSFPAIRFEGASRGGLLPTLYVSLAGLNAFDAYSTSKGLGRGATEANPLMRTVAGNPTMMWMVKAGVTGVSIATAERLWRKNKRAQAVAVMVISNGMMAAVAARNARVLQDQR